MKITILSFLISFAAMANPNACDDYLNRHYKKDLVPKSISFTEVKDPLRRRTYQKVKLTLKNQGQVDMNAISTDSGNRRSMKIKINGIERTVSFNIPFDSGQTQVVKFSLGKGVLKHCADANVAIDIGHTAGQWGCQVWNNDQKKIKALIPRTACPRFSFPRPTLPRPRF